MPNRTSKYPPKTVVNVAQCEIFAVTFVDGESIPDTRLVVKHGDSYHFLHDEKTDHSLRPPAGWLIKALQEKLEASVLDGEEDKIEELPMEATV